MSTAPRPSKASLREEAQAEALRLRAVQQRVAKRQRTIAIAALVVGVAVLAVIVTLIMAQANRSLLEDVARPTGSTLSGGIPVGPDGVAGTTDGAAADAIVVSVYADFLCPYCGLFETSNGPVLDELREAGEIVVEYHPVSILDRLSAGSGYSTRATTAVALVADQSPESFIEFNALLFANQPAENTEGLTNAEIADLATQAGVPDAVAATIEDGSFLEPAEDGSGTETSFVPWVAAATEQASKDLGSLSTPTILIDGEKLDPEVYDWRQDGVLAQAIEDARG